MEKLAIQNMPGTMIIMCTDWDEVMVLAEKTPPHYYKGNPHIHLTDTEKLINTIKQR